MEVSPYNNSPPGESSEIRMRLLEGYSTLYTSLGVRVSRIGAKLVYLSTTSKQAKVAPECCHAIQGWKWRCPLTEGHKCRECPLWKKKAKRVAHPNGGKVHQEERRPTRSIREKVQEGEERLRRMEEEKAVRPIKGKAQQEWRRSLIEELRKRAEKHCGKGVPEEVRLLEIGWMTKEIVVSYLTCKCGEKGSDVEDNRGQGVIPFWK